jgi:prolyl 4-hydroxylase
MSTKRLDAQWSAWLGENIARGCNTEELLGILLRNAFDIRSIRSAMGVHFPEHSPLVPAAERRAVAPVDLATISSPRLAQPGSGAVRVETSKLQLYVLAGFMSDGECDALVDLIDEHLRPSTITLPSNDKYFRTSRTSDLSLVQSPLVSKLDVRIALTLGISPAYSEGIQAQRYDVGQEFKAHTDYFEPGTDEYVQYGGVKGNRTWTFMVYLNDVESGGATHFVALDRSFSPVKGTALAWNNLLADGTVNPDTLHAGLPVSAGRKLIITKWFRERGKGPMAYSG